MKKLIGLLAVLSLIFACSKADLQREIISTSEAPAAIGPYSQAVKVGNMLYLSGQIAIDPATSQFVTGGITEQTQQVLKNSSAVLKAAGFSINDVVQCQVFLKDLNDYGALNNVYKTYFKENLPARAVVQAARIPKDALVEIMMVAVKTK
ncbi:MAG: hypothetical protein GWP06_00585 [Actinobacteria bacterium]|nr:hypothetical protein [Actinomycetota bacterium]